MLRRYSGAFSKNVPPWGYVGFLIVAVGWVFLVPSFWVFLGAGACLTAIAALGLAVVIGWAGEVSLAQAALVGTSVYTTGYFVREDGYDQPYLVGVLAGIIVATTLSSFVALATARISGIYVMVLTLGLQVTIQRTVFTYPSLAGGVEGQSMERPRFLGIGVDSDQAFYFLAFGVLVVVIALLSLFRSSRHGRALLLVRTDRQAAAAVGISPWRYKVLAFAIAGALAGIAGALTAPLYRTPPNPSQYLALASLFLLAIPVVAGFQSLLATVLVAFSFTMIPQAVESWHLSTFIVGGVGLVAGTLVGPAGMAGIVLGRLRERREAAALAAVGSGTFSRLDPGDRVKALVGAAAGGHGEVGSVEVDPRRRR